MIEFVLLLRVIPYLLTGFIAYQKGYKWLTFAMVYVTFVAIMNFALGLPSEVRATIGSGFALLMVKHVLDIQDRSE